jgi:hypothetical protein
MTKEYIGDGVYVSIDNDMTRLTTENGVESTNEIFLEPEVLRAFLNYIKRSELSTLLPSDNPTY